MVQDQARIQEIENFHHVLTDISYCECTARVREFILDAYVRGAQKSGGTAEHTQLEGNTAAPSTRYALDALAVCATCVCVHMSYADL